MIYHGVPSSNLLTGNLYYHSTLQIMKNIRASNSYFKDRSNQSVNSCANDSYSTWNPQVPITPQIFYANHTEVPVDFLSFIRIFIYFTEFYGEFDSFSGQRKVFAQSFSREIWEITKLGLRGKNLWEPFSATTSATNLWSKQTNNDVG